jgi:hypothetical protein
MRAPFMLVRISIYGVALSAIWMFTVFAYRLTGLIRFR